MKTSSNNHQLDEVKHRFELLVKTYHQAVINRKSQSDNYELEVKFGQDNFSEGHNTNIKITHHDYNNVIKTLKSLGFTYNLTGTKAGVDILRVQHVLDDNTLDRNEKQLIYEQAKIIKEENRNRSWINWIRHIFYDSRHNFILTKGKINS